MHLLAYENGYSNLIYSYEMGMYENYFGIHITLIDQ